MVRVCQSSALVSMVQDAISPSGATLRPAHGGGELIQPAELPQFGPEHAVILRQPARIVSLDIDDMAVLNAHVLSPDDGGTISGRPTRQELIQLG